MRAEAKQRTTGCDLEEGLPPSSTEGMIRAQGSATVTSGEQRLNK